ncbi:DUF58 domain-containing protein [Paenibacillus sp. OV219]|uniref:DUF58 domain-containing protein n=1 Tax=Paenibacillus sp. OV219 TaxID=1884377 RepID=UPI0008B51EDD|nr:DUF58 domain-containing protein [Paenibacillus sp. OV219]SEP02371.1 Uncharacterized conserved protein, DUF58 family, contains vWF domain [Paenibacillus sp. OV219]
MKRAGAVGKAGRKSDEAGKRGRAGRSDEARKKGKAVKRGEAGKPGKAAKSDDAGKSDNAGKSGVVRPKLRSRHVARAVVLLMLSICIAALYERSGAVEWLLVVVVGTIAFGSIILPYVAVGKIVVERIMAETSQLTDGGEMQVTLVLRLSGLLPFMWVGVREEFGPAEKIGETRVGGKKVKAGQEADKTVTAGKADNRNQEDQAGGEVLVQHVFLPGFGRLFQLNYTVKGLRRGEMLFQPVQVSMGDMFGLTVRTFTMDCAGVVLVKAAPPAGEIIADLPGHKPGMQTSGKHMVAAFGGQMQTSAARFGRHGAGPDVRSYMPGDPLGRVDWRAMARGLGLQTRTSNAEYSTELFVLLETSEQAYGGDIRLFDAHVGRAALLIKQAHREGRSVLLLTNAVDDLGLQADAGDRAAIRRAEEQLARLRWGKAGSMPLRLSDAVAGLSRGASLICLTAGELHGDELGEAGTILYSAKLAAVRGVELVVLLSARDAQAGQSEQQWRERLQAAKCTVRTMPVPLSYCSVGPGVVELTVTTGEEGGVVHVGSARS